MDAKEAEQLNRKTLESQRVISIAGLEEVQSVEAQTEVEAVARGETATTFETPVVSPKAEAVLREHKIASWLDSQLPGRESQEWLTAYIKNDPRTALGNILSGHVAINGKSEPVRFDNAAKANEVTVGLAAIQPKEKI